MGIYILNRWYNRIKVCILTALAYIMCICKALQGRPLESCPSIDPGISKLYHYHSSSFQPISRLKSFPFGRSKSVTIHNIVDLSSRLPGHTTIRSATTINSFYKITYSIEVLLMYTPLIALRTETPVLPVSRQR
jgi:hypothetical protein